MVRFALIAKARKSPSCKANPRDRACISAGRAALIGFSVAFFMAYTDNLRDMLLVIGGVIVYVLCDIAEKLKGK